MIVLKGRNNRSPSLAYKYRLNKHLLLSSHHEELKKYRLRFHPEIDLDGYHRLTPSDWERDLPFIKQIHTYLEQFDFPKTEVPAPERSVELFGDEKRITEHGGKDLLERIGLFERMKILPVSDPLMLAFNPNLMQASIQRHLIVENKTTYQALVDVLVETDFTTLIYGSGSKIIKSIEQFDRQVPIEATHVFYYFGDIDWSGISIWYRLDAKRNVHPALPFYAACLKKKALNGKTAQRQDAVALEAFVTHLVSDDAIRVRRTLGDERYYPQELLKSHELRTIWRESVWT